MCRLDSYVSYIIRHIGLPATSLGIHPGYVNNGVVYFILIVDRTNYMFHIVYNLLHVMLDDNCIIIWTSYCYVLLVCILYC